MRARIKVSVGERLAFRDCYRLTGSNQNAVSEGVALSVNDRGGMCVILDFTRERIFVAAHQVVRVMPSAAKPAETPPASARRRSSSSDSLAVKVLLDA